MEQEKNRVLFTAVIVVACLSVAGVIIAYVWSKPSLVQNANNASSAGVTNTSSVNSSTTNTSSMNTTVSNATSGSSSADAVYATFSDARYPVAFQYPKAWHALPHVSLDAVTVCDQATSIEGGEFPGVCIRVTRNVKPFGPNTFSSAVYTVEKSEKTLGGKKFSIQVVTPKSGSGIFEVDYESADAVVFASSSSKISGTSALSAIEKIAETVSTR